MNIQNEIWHLKELPNTTDENISTDLSPVDHILQGGPSRGMGHIHWNPTLTWEPKERKTYDWQRPCSKPTEPIQHPPLMTTQKLSFTINKIPNVPPRDAFVEQKLLCKLLTVARVKCKTASFLFNSTTSSYYEKLAFKIWTKLLECLQNIR